MADEIRLFELNTGAKIPSVGLGTWRAEPGVVADAKAAAIKIGHALKKLFGDGVLKREGVPITCQKMYQRHWIELFRICSWIIWIFTFSMFTQTHWPVSMNKGSADDKPEYLTQPDIASTWGAMEAIYNSGKVGAIGVSNFSSRKFQDLLEVARVPPAVNLVECHPSWNQLKLHAFCKSKGVHLSGYSPLGKRFSRSDVLKNQALHVVAERLGKTPAQVALRWGLQMGHSVLPKSTNHGRIKENFDLFDWSVPTELLANLSEIKQEKIVTGASFVHETYGAYRTTEELWDGEW